MENNMTLKRSLEICYLMWQWIADNNSEYKSEFFNSEYINTIFSDDEQKLIGDSNRCACCAYDNGANGYSPSHLSVKTYNENIRCHNCSLVGLWGTELCDGVIDPISYACERHKDSPYECWSECRGDMKVHAQELADMAFKRLQDYIY